MEGRMLRGEGAGTDGYRTGLSRLRSRACASAFWRVDWPANVLQRVGDAWKHRMILAR
eukprot:IDg16432t1